MPVRIMCAGNTAMSGSCASLTGGVVKTRLYGKVKMITGLVTVMSAVGGGIGFSLEELLAQEKPAAPASP